MKGWTESLPTRYVESSTTLLKEAPTASSNLAEVGQYLARLRRDTVAGQFAFGVDPDLVREKDKLAGLDAYRLRVSAFWLQCLRRIDKRSLKHWSPPLRLRIF